MAAFKTPKELGYRFPAEWEQQEAIWFAWPVRRTLWSECFDCVRKKVAALYVLAARYLNFVVLNGAVLVPAYSQSKNDAAALKIIGYCFPSWEIVADRL